MMSSPPPQPLTTNLPPHAPLLLLPPTQLTLTRSMLQVCSEMCAAAAITSCMTTANETDPAGRSEHCLPRHQTHFEPSFLDLNGII